MNSRALAAWGLLAQQDMLVVFVVVGVFVLAVVGGAAYHKHLAGVWLGFANRHGLTFSGGGWLSSNRINGTIDGRAVNVWTFTRGHGKNRSHHSAMSLSLPHSDAPRGVHVYRETFFSKVGKVFGGQDIQIGDAEFDKAFMIKGDHEDDVREWLNYDRQQAIISLRKHGGFELSESQLYVERRGTFSRQAELDGLLEDLTRCADGIA
jgi:hypothetical protein